MIEFIERKASSNVRTLGIGEARPRRLPAEAFGGRERERERERERCSRGGTYSDEVAGVSNGSLVVSRGFLAARSLLAQIASSSRSTRTRRGELGAQHYNTTKRLRANTLYGV